MLAVLIPIGYSLYGSYKASKQIKSSKDFFLFHEGLIPQKLRNSITASNLSLASAIFSFLGLGYYYKLAIIISPITWLLGFFILIKVFPKIKDLSKRTLHGYLAFRFQSKTIGYIASIASIIGFLGAYGVELLVSIKISGSLFPNIQPYSVAFVLSIIVAFYTFLGGFKAATHLDTFRLYLTYVGLLVVFLFSFRFAYQNVGSNQNLFHILSKDNWGISNLTPLFIVSLTLLNIPWQLVDMSVWQKLVACDNTYVIKKGLRQSISFTGIFWLLLIALGISLNFFPKFITPANDDFASLFLNYLTNPIVFALFAMGCFAAMMSTADSLLIASVQTLTFDIVFTHKKPGVPLDDSSYNSSHQDKNILQFGRTWILILGISAPIIVFLINLIIPGILDLFFLIYCAQLTLLVTILVAIFNKNPIRYKVIAVISVVLGLLTACAIFTKMLFKPNIETFLWAPIISVIASIIPWFFTPFLKKI